MSIRDKNFLSPDIPGDEDLERVLIRMILHSLTTFQSLRQFYFTGGLVYGLGSILVQLFIVFPIQAGKGLMDIDLGIMAPIFVLFFNAIWGVCTVF
jgi:hypothetical protein